MVDEQLIQSKHDAMKVVEMLRHSPYVCTMEWSELVVRFKRMLGLSEAEAIERIEKALSLLKRSQGLSWGGKGCAVHFSRTIPIVVI